MHSAHNKNVKGDLNCSECGKRIQNGRNMITCTSRMECCKKVQFCVKKPKDLKGGGYKDLCFNQYHMKNKIM